MTDFESGILNMKRGRQEVRMISGFKNGQAEKGFSLIELIVVLVILGLLVAVVAPNVYQKLAKGKDQIAKIQIKEIEGAIQLFSFDMGRNPNTAEGLEALVRNPGISDSWNGPYLAKKSVPMDPWGRPYAYRCPGDHGDYDLFSFGADGVEGNDDDICNWK
jgi:general secretion pathway protein G